MLIYFNNVWDGTAEPLWPHIILLSISIIAAFAVGFGIKLESPKYSAAVHCVATWLILGGIAVESLCTVSLFVFDERIGNAQQAKIIALEGRPWTKKQFDAIQEVRGKLKDVGIIVEHGCMECGFFAINLEIALNAAGVQMYEPLPTNHDFDDMRSTGVLVYLPEGVDFVDNPLSAALHKGDFFPAVMRHIPFSKMRADIPVIFIGERGVPFSELPFRPSGNAGWKMLPLEK